MKAPSWTTQLTVEVKRYSPTERRGRTRSSGRGRKTVTAECWLAIPDGPFAGLVPFAVKVLNSVRASLHDAGVVGPPNEAKSSTTLSAPDGVSFSNSDARSKIMLASLGLKTA